MKLELIGFRCHENTEIEIANGKITLLAGSSGQGKSTIFESLLFLFYDAVKKPFTFGKKKCKVVLHYDGYIITRQKNPNLLTISGGANLENDLAQQWIHNEFGTLEQFFSSSYIRQMEKHFMFNQSSSEIIDFIQSLAFDKEHISDWKQKLMDKKRHYEEHITKYEGRIQQQEYLLQNDPIIEQLSREEIEKLQHKSMLDRKEEVQSVELEEKEKRFEKEKKLEVYYKHLNKKKEVQKLKQNLDNMTQYDMVELEMEFNDVMEKLRVPISSLKQELNSVKKEWNDLKKKIGPNTKVEQKIPALQQEKEQMNKIQVLLDSIYFTKDFNELEPYVKKLQNELFDLEEKKKNLEISLQSIYWTKYTEFECPSCNKHLFFSNNKVFTELLKPEQVDIPIPDATEKELGIVTHKIDVLMPKLKQAEDILIKLEEFKNNKWTPDLDKKLEIYLRFQEVSKKKIELESKAENDNSLDVEQIQELETKRQEIQRKMKLQHQYEAMREQYEHEKQFLSEMEKVKEEELQDFDKQIHSVLDKKKTMLEEIKLLEKVIQHNKENAVLDELYKEKRKWTQKLEACVYLKQKTQEAETLYLEEVLEQINLEMNQYLEFLFDKNPMTIRFKTIKEMKSKKESKHQFDIEIFYKNEQYDNISQLSGGESIKISIAILLTFNKILNSKFILLDESLNPLDAESRMKVVDLLKSTNKTCIVISHDEINGVFDKVLTL